MTSTEKPEFDFSLFVEKNKQALIYAGAGVAVVAVGTWFWIASTERQGQRAEQAYVSAERSAYSGNPKLAEEDLKKVVDRYGSTPAGVRASVLLAKQYYEQSKPAEGIAALRAGVKQSAAKPFKAAMYALIAAGFENQNKFDSAAVAYGEAAEASTPQAEREQYQASQARAFMSAGKKPEALKVWQAIITRETSPLVSEAKLRIAELSVTPAKS